MMVMPEHQPPPSLPTPGSPPIDTLRTKLPNLPLNMARAALPLGKQPTVSTVVPSAEATLVALRVDEARLVEYRRLLRSRARMPLAFPQLAAHALHLNLISNWKFPLPALGLIHPGFTVECLQEIPLDESWEIRAWVSGQRNVRAGIEFDLGAAVLIEGVTVWRSRAVTLCRSKRAAGPDDPGMSPIETAGMWASQQTIDVPEGTGRAFARLSGDVNPIHLHAVSARPFGFRQPIAHGWWLLGRIAAVLDADEALPGRRADIVFRKPVVMPSDPELRWRPDAAGDTPGTLFALYADRDEDRPLVAGRISRP